MKRKLSRRDFLGVSATTLAGSLLAACAPQVVKETVEVEKVVKETQLVEKMITPTPEAPTAVPPRTEPVDIKFWTHWTGDFRKPVDEIIKTYNETQGAEDKIHITAETVWGEDYDERLTSGRLAGTLPDIICSHLPIIWLVANEFAMELPTDVAQAVKDNFVEQSVARVSYGGKVYGFPVEHEAQALVYRRSFLEKAGITEPPKTTDDIRAIAKEITREEGGNKYYGYTFWLGPHLSKYHFPGLIWRYGGDLFEWDGDVPVKSIVNSDATAKALEYWLGMVQDGSTNVGEMDHFDAWTNHFGGMVEIEGWFPQLHVKMFVSEADYQDLGMVSCPIAPGKPPVSPSYGWNFVINRDSPLAAEALKFATYMELPPGMPWIKFYVETVGSLPAVKNYPLPIPTWSEVMNKAYAKDTTPIARAIPEYKVLGYTEIADALTETVDAVLLQEKDIPTALKELDENMNAILARTDAGRL